MKRVLIVDDEAEVGSALATQLIESGFSAVAYDTAVAAVEASRTGNFDLVVTDIQMPDMNGIELFHHIESLKIPVIFMSGFSPTFDMKEASNIGAVDYLSKPFSIEDLKNSIEMALHYRGQAPEPEPENQDCNYCRVHIQDFISGSKSQMDVYVRISQQKYLRVARADSPLSITRLQSYYNKGLKFLYIPKEAFAVYVSFNLKLIAAVNKGRGAVPPARKISLVRQATEAYMEDAFINGMDRENFDYAKALVESAIQMACESDHLYEIIEALRDHHDIVYAHSLGVSVYATMIAREIGWTGAPSIFKVSMAGFLHDIGKRELPRSLCAKTKSEMTYAEIQLYESHTTRGRDLLRSFPFVAEEIVQAVGQHHENNLGHGFPLGILRGKIHPLAKIVHLADVFCHLLIRGHQGTPCTSAEALKLIYSEREAEFEPALIRALYVIFGVEIPERLKKISTSLDVNIRDS